MAISLEEMGFLCCCPMLVCGTAVVAGGVGQDSECQCEGAWYAGQKVRVSSGKRMKFRNVTRSGDANRSGDWRRSRWQQRGSNRRIDRWQSMSRIMDDDGRYGRGAVWLEGVVYPRRACGGTTRVSYGAQTWSGRSS